jgi:hypothetical protein
MNYWAMFITHMYSGEVYALALWDAEWTNISEEDFVMHN